MKATTALALALTSGTLLLSACGAQDESNYDGSYNAVEETITADVLECRDGYGRIVQTYTEDLSFNENYSRIEFTSSVSGETFNLPADDCFIETNATIKPSDFRHFNYIG
ncbi:MAG: hypothetical protein CMP22_03715 [Rickettsiales bacterium]|nr:hypothetical protein [Rickettsiales bacterium]|tara:strand:- start:421 stop:750 length:330 start_codon:yes stop_codon:yes gene_type:complete